MRLYIFVGNIKPANDPNGGDNIRRYFQQYIY
ncbi:hypothetical protein STG2_140 [Salmonella phage STG2]|uniref:Uncharacterized protein n=5 Tax=Caudoviricetes TaxID=2731619 RepID=A0AAF0CCX5_9CAUD|nr:hypothetical protein HOU44_gp095 [Salmonella phage STG2]QDJ99961.1 hypothetical protein HEDJPLGI_00040 [Escherichia phage vB_EcoS-26175I]QDK00082.1 hypothetical protein EGCEDKNN_00002 [Escherichia phage vB_EcoS-26175II]QDK00239.1 hypothetical protein INCEGHDL_00001 [Escherichia phage vB_EcoS-26175III]QDK00457.1 hypothetical protein BNKMLPFJ_00061 [Escherichia phage vB_EcoS-26175IV]QDK00694.1 hypothetical protein JOHFDMOO_00171 [Escherichia phage vB_EcoS-26175V]QXV80332.1 hypothetical prote